MVRSIWSLPACALLVLASGCQDRSAESAAAAAANSPATPAPQATPAPPAPVAPEPEAADVPATETPTGPDAWLGQWTGPEGTFLRLEKREDFGYTVTIQSLDGPESYPGDAAGQGIVFERNGVTETIRVGSGKATGMKWLADKSNCLVIKAGEGFCRD